MRLPLLLYPNPALTWASDPVDPETAKSDEFKGFLSNLHETLIWFRGVGLSAVQTRRHDRVFAMRTGKGKIISLVNPVLKSTDGEAEPKQEGCLSLPGVVEEVLRFPNVVIGALDLETGEEKLYDLEGVEAQCAQHELDHLDGKMFSDYYGRVKRDIVKRKIGKQLRLNPLFQEPQ